MVRIDWKILLADARSRNANAQFILGIELFADYTRIDEAFEWLRSAAENGHKLAFEFLTRPINRDIVCKRVSAINDEKVRFFEFLQTKQTTNIK